MAYIEFARTPASPRYKEFNVHKERGLLVTPVIKDHEGHKSYLREDRCIQSGSRSPGSRVVVFMVDCLCFWSSPFVPVEWNPSRSTGRQFSSRDVLGEGTFGQVHDPTLGTWLHH